MRAIASAPWRERSLFDLILKSVGGSEATAGAEGSLAFRLWWVRERSDRECFSCERSLVF